MHLANLRRVDKLLCEARLFVSISMVSFDIWSRRELEVPRECK